MKPITLAQAASLGDMAQQVFVPEGGVLLSHEPLFTVEKGTYFLSVPNAPDALYACVLGRSRKFFYVFEADGFWRPVLEFRLVESTLSSSDFPSCEVPDCTAQASYILWEIEEYRCRTHYEEEQLHKFTLFKTFNTGADR